MISLLNVIKKYNWTLVQILCTCFVFVFQVAYICNRLKQLGALSADAYTLQGLSFNLFILVILDITLVLFSFNLFANIAPGVVSCLVLAFSDFALKMLVSMHESTYILGESVSVLLCFAGCLLLLRARCIGQSHSIILCSISTIFFVFSTYIEQYIFFFVSLLFLFCVIFEYVYRRRTRLLQMLVALSAYIVCVFVLSKENCVYLIRQCILGNAKSITFPYLVNVDYCLSFVSQDTIHMEWFLDQYVLRILIMGILIATSFVGFVFVLCRKEKFYSTMRDKTVSILRRVGDAFGNTFSDVGHVKCNNVVILVMTCFMSVFAMARCLDVWSEYSYANVCFYFLMPFFILLVCGALCGLLSMVKWNPFLVQCVIYIGSIVCVLIIARLKSIPQEYDQFIIENLAFLGTNKTNELNVFYLFLLLAMFFSLVVGLRYTRSEKEISNIGKTVFTIISKCKLFVLFFVFSSMGIYGLLAIANLFAVVPNCGAISLVGGIATSLAAMCFSHSVQSKIIICLQCVLPFSLLVYVNSNYIYRGERVQMIGSPIYFSIIIVFISILVFINVRKIRDVWKVMAKDDGRANFGTIISKVSCVVIAAFASFPGASLIVTDQHHPGEMVVSFAQVFFKGANLYDDYYPVSGLFSVVLGAINEMLGGKYSWSAQTAALFCLIISAATAYLLCSYFSTDLVSILSFLVILALPPYMIRTQFVLPMALIILSPKIKQQYQFFLYCLFSLIMGLYYPLYGAAFAVGFLPYEVKTVIVMIKSRNLAEHKKNICVKVLYAILLVVVICCVPLLWKMAMHMMVYSSQSLLADGYTVIGQLVPDSFLPFLSHFAGIRMLVFYSLWFFVPLSIVSFCCNAIGSQIKKDGVKSLYNNHIYILLFVILYSLISFTYSQMRVEANLLGRTIGVLFPLVPIMFLITWYQKKSNRLYAYLYGGLILWILIIYDASLLSGWSAHYMDTYVVSDELILVQEDVGKLGSGFYEESIYNDYLDVEAIKDVYGDTPSYTGMYLSQIYASDVKTIGQPNMIAMKSRVAVDETTNLFEKNDVVVSNKMTPYGQYRWNKFLMTSADMVYDGRTNSFLSKSFANKLGIEGDSKQLYQYQMENIGAIANTLGKSYATYGASWLTFGTVQILSGTVSNQILADETRTIYKKDYSFELNEGVRGDQNDFLYITINTETYGKAEDNLEQSLMWTMDNTDIMVVVSWEDEVDNEYYISSYLGDGRLLFPMGMNSSWYTLNPQVINVSIVSTARDVAEVEINNIEFHKLDE